MSLSDLASLGSFISGVAVLVSLVFLYFQLRQVIVQVMQTEKNQQSAIRQNRATRTVDIILSTLPAEVAEAVQKGLAGTHDMTLVQLQQFRTFCRASFHNAEDTYFQHEDGLLSESAFATWKAGAAGVFAMPGYRAMWKQQHGQYHPRFVAFIDGFIASVPAAAPVDQLAQWKAALADETARAVP